MLLRTSSLAAFCLFIASAQARPGCLGGWVVSVCETDDSCSPADETCSYACRHERMREICRRCACYWDSRTCFVAAHGECRPDGPRVPFPYYELGVVGDSKYLFAIRQKKAFDDAKEACEDKGGHLAIMESANETAALNALILAAPEWVREGDIYLGGYSDDPRNGPWFWINGAPLSRDNPEWDDDWSHFVTSSGWGYRYPPHCLVVKPRFLFLPNKMRWRPTRCVYSRNYICEVPNVGHGER